MCEAPLRLCVLRDRSQTCPFLLFMSLPPLGEGAPVCTLGRMRGQFPAPSLVGAHTVRPPFFAHNPPQGRHTRAARRSNAYSPTGDPRGSPPQLKAPFWKPVGEGLKVNCPEGAREATLGCAPPASSLSPSRRFSKYSVICRRGGTPGRPPSNRRTPPKFPIYVSKRPTKGQISPYLSSPKAFPPQGADSPCQGADSPCQGEMAGGQKG